MVSPAVDFFVTLHFTHQRSRSSDSTSATWKQHCGWCKNLKEPPSQTERNPSSAYQLACRPRATVDDCTRFPSWLVKPCLVLQFKYCQPHLPLEYRRLQLFKIRACPCLTKSPRSNNQRPVECQTSSCWRINGEVELLNLHNLLTSLST